MNVKYFLEIQPNVSNQIQSAEMCAKKEKNNNKRKKKRYAMLCYMSVFVCLFERITEPLPWFVTRARLRVFTTITIIIIFIIAGISWSSRAIQVL